VTLSEEKVRDTVIPLPYSDEELFATGPQKTYTGAALSEIAFPLGGIGSGCVSLSGRGALVDWEIFNRPNKGYRPSYTFLSLFARTLTPSPSPNGRGVPEGRGEGGEPVFRVLEGRLQPPYQGPLYGPGRFAGFGWGPRQSEGAGLLRFAECSFTGEFPLARVDLSDEAVPVSARIEAWSPFIPLNDRDSSFPVAILDITLTNVRAMRVQASVAFSLENIVGWPEVGQSTNRLVNEDGLRGVVMTTERHAPESPRFGSIALLTPHEDITWELRRDLTWFRGLEDLLFGFGETGRFADEGESITSGEGQTNIASLGLRTELEPGESKTLTFVLAWHSPNFEQYFGAAREDGSRPTWPNYYARLWPDATAVAREVIQRREELERDTRRFHDVLFASTLPTYVLDAISSQMAILRSPTVLRLPDGTVYGFEGCHADAGCCEGSCTHVWNYTQTMAYLFPRLERGMRETDYTVNLRESDGHMQFRMELPPGTSAGHGFHAAADGQMGGILRTYREWQISGDDEWLATLWPRVKKALEYAWEEWDKDRDGLLEGIHHNTLDIEFHGPETMCGSLYLAALLAGERMARHLGDDAAADEYRRVFESGRKLTDETLYNGEYYYQRITPGDASPYQFGEGCICDQVIGQWHARMLGLGDVYDPHHVKSAIASVFRCNFCSDFFSRQNPHRVYALNDDKGLLICTWPRGNRPERSVTYAFECMIGFEYQVGAHLVYEGFLREGLTVCKAIRDRHDGLKRNPWNEFECGNHYARSMANYAYLLALSGFHYSAVEKSLEFAPRVFEDDFRCFFSVDSGWGMITQKREGDAVTITVEVVEGKLVIERIVAGSAASAIVELSEAATAEPGRPLVVVVGG